MLTQSCLTLCDPTDPSSPGSFVHGIAPATILVWATVSSSRDLPTRSKPVSPASAGGFFTTAIPGKPPKRRCVCVCVGHSVVSDPL